MVVPLSIVLIALLVIAAVAFAAFIYKHNVTTRSTDPNKPSLLSMTSRTSDHVDMGKDYEDEKVNDYSEAEKRLSYNENVEFGNKDRHSTEFVV